MKEHKTQETNNTVKSGLFWDQLYRQLHSRSEPALWDVLPSSAIEQDYDKFKSVFDPNLPLIDIGCGTGVQTGYLSTKYTRITGIDASKKAIKLAKKNIGNANIEFEVMDLLDQKTMIKYYNKNGDSNIYIRGVLHQIPIQNRQVCIENIKMLMGTTGALYMIETASNIQEYIRKTITLFPTLPSSLKNVMTSNFPPIGVSKNEIQQWFDKNQYNIIAIGNTELNTNLVTHQNTSIALPAIYSLINKV